MPLHSTLFILVRMPVMVLNTEYDSTFHSVYISTKRCTASQKSRQLYIPLCLYQYAFGGENGQNLTALHSTLFILVRAADGISAGHYPGSTFHSVYISTEGGQYKYGQTTFSTFHSVYISTCHKKECSYLFLPLHSTLFILVLTPFSSAVQHFVHSTFHSVYISTVKCHSFHLLFFSLHSTLFILVLGRVSSDLLFFSSTFHSVYISTNRFNHVSPLNKLPLHSTLFILVRWRKIS